MDILSSLGQMYMFILLILLFVGSGLAAWAFINNFVPNTSQVKPGARDKGKPPAVSKAVNNIIINDKPEEDKKIGSFRITDSRWFKLALYSLAGILLSVTLLGFTATNSSNVSAHNHSSSQNAMNGAQAGSMPVNNMPMNNGMPNDYMMMQQLSMMQQQLNRMQQQIMNMRMQQNNSGMNMQQNGGMGGM